MGDNFELLRSEYYEAGRNLFFSSQFSSAGIMLGYAIETHIKAGLLKLKTVQELDNVRDSKNTRILHSHCISDLFKTAQSLNLFKNVNVSDDFLNYVDDHFQRYPSEILKMQKSASMKSRIVFSGGSMIMYYDDFILQLDDEIISLTQDPLLSIGYRAAFSISYCFFHCNGAAFNRKEKYLEILKKSKPEMNEEMYALENMNWKTLRFGFAIGNQTEVQKIKAGDYKYDEYIKDENGRIIAAHLKF
jgi:hypothetical protein